MHKFSTSLLLSLLGFFLLVSTAFAHVTANPRSAEPGFGVTTIRVPNEKDNPTVELRVVVPDGVAVNAVKPVPGWTFTVNREEISATPMPSKDNDEEENGPRITEITWSGGQINPGEFEEFPLSIQYTATGDIAWKAYQTYADGETVNWEGPKDSEHPASIVTVAEAAQPTQQVQPPVSQNQWLSILALLFAIAALFVSLRKK